jgi:AAHS family 4-hydroxybenzoate transporter-like MFS transporter
MVFERQAHLSSGRLQMATTLDIRSELEKPPVGPRHWTLVLILCFVTLLDGYDTFVPAYVIPYAIQEWHLPPSRAGLLVSSGLIGFMIGSLLVGLIADRIGRKPTLLGGLLIASFFDLVTASQARSFEMFVGLRLLTGLGLGMLLPLAVTLVNEFAPRRATNLLVGCVMIGWSGGGILAALTGLALAPRFGWPALFWVSTLASIPLVIASAFVLRESPRFLAVKDRQPQLRRVMMWLLPGEAHRYVDANFTTTENVKHTGSISRLLAPSVRRSTLIVWLCAACSLFTIFGLSSWVPTSMIQRGETFGASFAFGALLQFMAVLGGVGCGWTADRLERHWVLAASWGIATLAIAGLALVNYHWTNVLFVAIAGFFMMGAQPVLNNFTASLYPTEIKSTGVGIELSVGRLGGILGPYAGGWLKELFPGSRSLGLFVAMATAVAVCALSITLLRKRPKA